MIWTSRKPSASSASRIAPTRPSIMSEGAMTSAPARSAFAHQAVVAVAGVRVERDVGDEAKLGKLALDRTAGAADEVSFIEGLAPLRVLERNFGVGEERDRRDVQLNRPLSLAHGLFDGQPVDAWHRGYRNALLLAVDQKQRPDEVARRQHMLGDQPPRPFRLAVAARAVGEVEAMGRGDAGGFIHGDLGAFANIIIPNMFALGRQPQQRVDRDILVEVCPVNTLAAADQTPVEALCVGGVAKGGEPLERR